VGRSGRGEALRDRGAEHERQYVESLRAAHLTIVDVREASDRLEATSALGPWSYEVYDTKLARETRGSTILQLAVYSELLAAL